MILRRSSIDKKIIDRLLNDPYFGDGYGLYGNLITPSTIQNDTHQAVFDFLDSENYDYHSYIVEYWFQDFDAHVRNELVPHVDFNLKSWNKYSKEPNNEILNKNKLVSPITITAYLDITDDIDGGELCITSCDWFDLSPFDLDLKYIKERPHETYIPKTGDVFYFEGSKYYHWVNEIRAGRRRSIGINFWKEDQIPADS